MRVSNGAERTSAVPRDRRVPSRERAAFREALARAEREADGPRPPAGGLRATTPPPRVPVPAAGRSGSAGGGNRSKGRGAGRVAGPDPVEALLARLVEPPPVAPGAGREHGGASRGGEDDAGRGDAPAAREPGAGSLLLAAAVERIVLLVNAGAAPALTVQLGRSVEVRVAQAESGVEVTLRAARGLSPLAEAELPLLVAALRARGVRVARAGVQGPGAGGPSLTTRRASDTRHGDDGSVAKW